MYRWVVDAETETGKRRLGRNPPPAARNGLERRRIQLPHNRQALLKKVCRWNLPVEWVISEAQPDTSKDTIRSLPRHRAAWQLAGLYKSDPMRAGKK